jgi:tetratricopeptide (TPR) repeat protein
LYTNRAQAYIKLEKYNKAINDCDWALKIDEKCIKALIHRGRALTYLKEFDKAHLDFENAKTIDLKQSETIDDYLKELNRVKLAESQEKNAQTFLKNNKTNDSLNDYLEILNKKIYKKDQSIMYYSDGIRCLATLCNDGLSFFI